MRTAYIPPKGVIQLSYGIPKDLAEELKRFSEREQYNVRIVRIKLTHQSDKNFCKYAGKYPFDMIIGNFINGSSHVYLQILEIQRTFNVFCGAHYKISVAPIKRLPK